MSIVSNVCNNLLKKLKTLLCIQQQYSARSSSTMRPCWKWDVSQFISQDIDNQVKYAVMVLNRPIVQNQMFLKSFWNNAAVRVTVDGGTVQWDSYMKKFPKETQDTLAIPELVTGDFDSITDEILQNYKNKGCKIVNTPDQNYTDFTKALMELNKYCQQNEMPIENVIAICQASGRLDQILGNIQTLFLERQKQLLDPGSRLFLMSDDALSWLLCPGDHVIEIPQDVRNHKRVWCSVVPIGETCQSITTRGLKWDLENSMLKFGDLVSTSNTFSESETVTISTSQTVLWSMKVPSLIGSS